MSHVPRNVCCYRSRGAILLEIVLALGLFVATAITLLSVVGGAIDSLNRSRERLVAADHARNAMAMIEAGIARPETLIGPVMPWSGTGDGAGSGDDDFEMGDFAGFASQSDASLGLDGDTGWALEIDTEPADRQGLTLVTVRAYRVDDGGGEGEGGASFALRQIMVLSAGPTDGVSDGGDEFQSGAFGGGP